MDTKTRVHLNGDYKKLRQIGDLAFSLDNYSLGIDINNMVNEGITRIYKLKAQSGYADNSKNSEGKNE
jgi:hypothetical protein